MTVVILARWNVRILTRQSIAAWNIWTFSYSGCRSTYQRHNESFAVWRRYMRAKIVMHWVAVTRGEGIKVGAVPKRGIGVLASSALVLPPTWLVRVVRILLAVDWSQSLGFHHEWLLFFVAQAAPLRSQQLADFAIQHVRVLECELASLGPRPNHERVHRTLNVLIWICHVDFCEVSSRLSHWARKQGFLVGAFQ